MYLLLKSEQVTNEAEAAADLLDVVGDANSAIQSHPVITRLQQLNKFAQKLEERVECKVDTLSEQLENLVKANDLMNADEGYFDSLKHDSESEAAESAKPDDEDGFIEGKNVAGKQDACASKVSNSSSSEEESEEDIAASVMNDARFGLRAQEIGTPQDNEKRHSRRPVPLDYGDNDDEETGLTKKATQSLASTINAIEQRSATRSQKKRPAPTTEALDGEEDDNDALRQGLEMMEAELGRLESDDEEETNTEVDEELNDNSHEDDFYMSVKERSKSKKQRRAAMYAVAPKYPGMDQEIQGKMICCIHHFDFCEGPAILPFSLSFHLTQASVRFPRPS